MSLSDAPRLASAALIAAAVLGGCGSGGGPPNGEEQKPAAAIMADVQAALGRAHSFHLSGTSLDVQGDSRIDGDVVLPGRFRMKIQSGMETTELLMAGGQAYVRGNRPFIRDLGGPVSLADKWIHSNGDDPGLAQFMVVADPALIGRCMFGTQIGTLTKLGTDKVDGQDAVVIQDAGDIPGGTPRRIYVATHGDPLPLRLQQIGPKKPGGTPDITCGETADVDTTTHGEMILSNWNGGQKIEAPGDAVYPSQVAR